MMKLMTTIFGFCGVVSSVYAKISIIGTTEIWDSNGKDMRINTPSGTEGGDLLLLAAYRTEGVLPVKPFNGWKRRAECFKTDNGYDCQTVTDCRRMSGNYCSEFKRGKGRDLSQVIYTKRATSSGSKFNFDLGKGNAAWLILASLRGVDVNNPVRDWEGVGADGSRHSIFPSINVAKGDMVLLSQAFDDRVKRSVFKAPSGFQTVGYVSGHDETAFLYAKLWNNGKTKTGKMTTTGSGGRRDQTYKDALISLSFIEGKGEEPEDEGEETCDFDDVKKKCSDDGCKNLVWIVKYRTCERYCASQNAKCVGAWNDYGNRCDTRGTSRKWGCRSDFRSLRTSDAICQCKIN